MKCIVHDDVVLSRPLEGPLSAHIVAFAKWARDEGYASSSRWRKVFLAAGLAVGWDSRLSACTASPQSMLLATCDLT